MTKHYDEQDGFRKKTGESDFKLRAVGPRAEPARPATDGDWTLLDQVAGRHQPPAAVGDGAPAVADDPLPAEPVASADTVARPRFRSLLSASPSPSTEAVSGAYNGTPLKSLLRRIAERQAKTRPPGFDAWR